MAARKKAAPKPDPVEEVAVETEPDAPESDEAETIEAPAQTDSDDSSTPAESESPARYEDGGLAALQARFDNASRQGYFGPDKEF
jgi:hypothetical protein